MSYTPPGNTEITASWVGATAYTPPAATEITASWVPIATTQADFETAGEGILGASILGASTSPILTYTRTVYPLAYAPLGIFPLGAGVVTTEGLPGESDTPTVTPGKIRYIGGSITTKTTGPEVVNVFPSKIRYIGGNTITVAPDIRVNDAYSVGIQLTVDQYYLSDNIDTFDESQYYWPPGISEMPLSIVGFNKPTGYAVAEITYATQGYRTVTSYMDDYYYRIHINPNSINYGNILTDKTVELEIWNAFLNTVDFNSLTQNGLDGIVANLGFTLPKTYQRLESTLASVTALAQGAPTTDGYLEFNFNVGTYLLTITGKRSVFFPFVPDVNFTETREWLTDVISHRKGEQKFALREIPRMYLSYNYTFRTEEEYGNAKQFASTQMGFALATALWTETIHIGQVFSTDTIIYFDTSYLEYDTTDGVVVLWESYNHFSLHEVQSIAADSITLKLAVGKDYTDCWVAPVKIGRAMGGINLQRSEGKVPSGKIDISFILNPFTSASWTASTTYLSYPVLEEKLVLTGGLSDRGTRKFSTFDAVINGVEIYSEEEYNRLNQTIRLTATTRQDRYNLRRLIDWFQGKYKSFWLPSFNNDAVALTNIAAFDNAVKIEYNNWVLTFPKYIRIIGNYTHYAQVTNVINNLDGTEDVIFDPAVPTTLNSIRRIEVINLVRLNTDRIEFTQETAIRSTVTLPVIQENF